MPNKRDLKLDKFAIGMYGYRELSYFCLQYSDKKRMVAKLKGQVGQDAKITQLTDDIRIIEKAAYAVDPILGQYILKNVTQENTPYEYMPVPSGRRQFYQARQKFFYLLALEKHMV